MCERDCHNISYFKKIYIFLDSTNQNFLDSAYILIAHMYLFSFIALIRIFQTTHIYQDFYAITLLPNPPTIKPQEIRNEKILQLDKSILLVVPRPSSVIVGNISRGCLRGGAPPWSVSFGVSSGLLLECRPLGSCHTRRASHRCVSACGP